MFKDVNHEAGIEGSVCFILITCLQSIQLDYGLRAALPISIVLLSSPIS